MGRGVPARPVVGAAAGRHRHVVAGHLPRPHRRPPPPPLRRTAAATTSAGRRAAAGEARATRRRTSRGGVVAAGARGGRGGGVSARPVRVRGHRVRVRAPAVVTEVTEAGARSRVARADATGQVRAGRAAATEVRPLRFTLKFTLRGNRGLVVKSSLSFHHKGPCHEKQARCHCTAELLLEQTWCMHIARAVVEACQFPERVPVSFTLLPDFTS